jgi:hypothetical protein
MDEMIRKEQLRLGSDYDRRFANGIGTGRTTSGAPEINHEQRPVCDLGEIMAKDSSPSTGDRRDLEILSEYNVIIAGRLESAHWPFAPGGQSFCRTRFT